ncbi:hypothetical protein EC844_11327 [Acinetobacter calcoaceticus]|uniref:Uncharacterized protein n=1 Tax=Acinetobacter calcoaceticus TaxID=471 RepID=A0A4R1XQ89_ACICA|nr:hypothetical protein EC844_11327 [Acinetobacter calcoaceticus]
MSEPKKPFPYLVVGISLLLGCMFLGLFFLAVTSEPDYMPSQKNKAAHTQSAEH